MEILEKEYIEIKPHHFLDFLYDLAVNERHIGEEKFTTSNNAILCRLFLDGGIKKLKFTPFVDDICKPCKKLIDGKRCEDYFDDETTLYYGFRYKNDFNYQLDIKLNSALPDIFNFEKVQNTIDILNMLKNNLTAEIINLYLWNRPDRVKNTFIGIEKGIILYR